MVESVNSVRDLGVYLNTDMSMGTHISKLVSSCFGILRQILCIRRSLTRSSLSTVITAFILSKVDYCNVWQNVTLIDFIPSLMPLLVFVQIWPRHALAEWFTLAPSSRTYNVQVVHSGVQLSSWHGAAVSTRCHSACCWSNIALSTEVCIVIRSCGASNTSFITCRQSLRCSWTTRMEQFTWVRHLSSSRNISRLTIIA